MLIPGLGLAAAGGLQRSMLPTYYQDRALGNKDVHDMFH